MTQITEAQLDQIDAALKEALQGRAQEIRSEIHEEYNEVPFWILLYASTPVREAFEIFLRVTAPWRSSHGESGFTVSFETLESNARLWREFIPSDEMHDIRLNGSFETGKNRQALDEHSVFEAERALYKSTASKSTWL